eukprot:TRINITY_DN5474_c0_g1_i3.p1 TRINITY_DN5474_c0_g1~~TRINITY_DN5474_c0_g1_i3.p1  ORF type:complete len:288 (+),score=26.62 TRINITY_DN5474_c0_g1_i3:24-866(+)
MHPNRVPAFVLVLICSTCMFISCILVPPCDAKSRCGSGGGDNGNGGGYAAAPPRVFLWNGESLLRAKQQRDTPQYAPAIRLLVLDAENSMKQGPWNVMQKNFTAPSGNKHDYLSYGTYWWPCNWNWTQGQPIPPPGCNTTSGLPWVQRDGVENPICFLGDKYPIAYMTSNVTTLALAYYFTGNESYAARASLLIKTWFLDPSTYMTPSLIYAQTHVGDPKPVHSGLIDVKSFVDAGGMIINIIDEKNIGGNPSIVSDCLLDPLHGPWMMIRPCKHGLLNL